MCAQLRDEKKPDCGICIIDGYISRNLRPKYLSTLYYDTRLNSRFAVASTAGRFSGEFP